MNEIIDLQLNEDELATIEYFAEFEMSSNELLGIRYGSYSNQDTTIIRKYKNLLENKEIQNESVQKFELILRKFLKFSLDVVEKATNKKIKSFELNVDVDTRDRKTPYIRDDFWHYDVYNQDSSWRITWTITGPSTPVYSNICKNEYRAKTRQEVVAFTSSDIDERKQSCHAVPGRKETEKRWMLKLQVNLGDEYISSMAYLLRLFTNNFILILK